MDVDVAAIRSLNETIAADPRVKVVLIPIGDGVSFVQKLGALPVRTGLPVAHPGRTITSEDVRRLEDDDQ